MKRKIAIVTLLGTLLTGCMPHGIEMEENDTFEAVIMLKDGTEVDENEDMSEDEEPRKDRQQWRLIKKRDSL